MTATESLSPFSIAGQISVDVEADKAPRCLIVTDLCGRVRANVPWDGTRADVLSGGKVLAAECFGEVQIVTQAGVRYYAEELGL